MGRSGSSGSSALRIIGGEWRGRKIPFTEHPGLRPTGDRIRETLFNWLAPQITGARCLDLFAGSGILGIEALSRGAAHCDFFDNHPESTRNIAQQLVKLGADSKSSVRCGDALSLLAQEAAPWDIIFIDPPFDSALGETSLQALALQGCLHQKSWIYFETRRSHPVCVPEDKYTVFREKTAGDVRYQLLQLRAA